MSYPKNKEESYTVSGGVNTKVSPYNTARNELLNLVNMEFVTLDAATKRDGTTLYLGATVSGNVPSLYQFDRLSGASYVVATANTNAYTVTSSFNVFKTGLLNNGIFDFVTFVDRLFMGNGQDFFKFDGVNAVNFSLPAGISSALFGVTGGGFTTGTGLSGVYLAGYGYLNDRGYFGPTSQGVTVSLNGISYNTILFTGLTTPSGYGITAISLYRSEAGLQTMFGTTNIGITASFIDYAALTNREQVNYLQFTLAPRYLELYNNQLFLAGFSSALSTVYWSDIGEPEGILPESFAEFRTNDGDSIMGMRSYLSDLIVAKERSFHKLSGENPDNFSLQQISDQYGCLSNRTMVVFNNTLLFLDSKGIIRYNGANLDVLSTPIEDILLRMNVAAAKQNAVAVHDRLKNQVIFFIPIDGSTKNNFGIVWDYVSTAFSFIQGPEVAALTFAQGRLNQRAVMYGGYTGTVANFASDVESDLGQGFTCLIKTRFMTLMGQSIEQQFRRFFLNIEPVLGFTQPINMKFYTNFGSTVQASFTIYQQPFQTRVDFGLPAKTFSAEISHFSATLSFKVYGWTLESRYQRSV